MIPDVTQQGRPFEQAPAAPVVPVVYFQGVSKSYGRIHALSNITLGLSGGVTGILGMNGAGKSTLFKLLMGKLRPSAGEVKLFGVNPWKNPAPYAKVGFVPEHEKMHDWMTAHEFVSTFARLHGMARDEASREAMRVLEFVGLGDVANKGDWALFEEACASGPESRALVNDPELIVLDEPLQGCDPLARTTIMNVIRELGKLGRTVLVSSHILSEIERITEQIIIPPGKTRCARESHAIRERLDQIPHTIRLVGEDARGMAKDILGHPAVYGLSFPNDRELLIQTYHFGELHAQLPSLIVENGHKVHLIDNPDDDLESLLRYLTGGSA